MSLSSNTDAQQHDTRTQGNRVRLDRFPTDSIFSSLEQKRRFELLRLAFFVLKLRKLNEEISFNHELILDYAPELAFRRNLLQHAIFQQILTLTKLDAREQAMQIISTCQKQ